MRSIPTDCKDIINLDLKFHGGLSIISYAVDYARKLGKNVVETNCIIEELYNARDFDDMLRLFNGHFGHLVTVIYRNKKV